MNVVEEDVPYAAEDGVRAELRLFRGSQPEAPVVVLLPAMGIRASYYWDLARALAAGGVHAVTSDLRGLGSSSERPSRACDFGYHEMLTRDLPSVLVNVRERFPRSRCYLLGHSLGGQLALLYLASNPDAASGAVLVASCNVHYTAWPFPQRLAVLGFAYLLRGLGIVFGYVPGRQLGFGGTEARSVIIDWSNNCCSGRYVIKGSTVDYDTLLSRMRRPVLCISIVGDRFAPARAVANLLSKIPRCDVTHQQLGAHRSGSERLNHFNWVRHSSSAVVDATLAWIRNQGPSRPEEWRMSAR